MILRRAGPDDVEALNRISVQSKRHWGYPEEWMERWKEDLVVSEEDLKSHLTVLAEVQGQPAGFAMLGDQPDQYEILHLWLLPEFIGKGLGGQLLDHLLGLCTDPKPIIVEADPNAQGFYERHGFETFDKVASYPEGRFLPVMRKMPIQGIA